MSKRLLRIALMIVVPVVAIVGGLAFYASGGRYVSTDNAYVKADKAAIAPEISGQVVDVAVHENQTVTAGQVLFRIDERPFRIALDRADADLRKTENDLRALRASFAGKSEEIRLAEMNA